MIRVGDDLVEAFGEMAAYLRGEVQAEVYQVPPDILTGEHPRASYGSISPASGPVSPVERGLLARKRLR
jgi:putative transcriptional regulator